jgi:hypothetical protein
MNKRTTGFVAGLLIIAVVGAYALDVLKPGAATPAQLVLARKTGMRSFAANVADIKAKTAAGSLKAIAANAQSIVAVGTIVPLVFTDTYSAAYPAPNKFFFKGATADEFNAHIQPLVDAAEKLASFAGSEDKAGIDAQTASLQAACGACHGNYRGQN